MAAGFFRTVFAIFARAMMAPERISHKQTLIKMNGISFPPCPARLFPAIAPSFGRETDQIGNEKQGGGGHKTVERREKQHTACPSVRVDDGAATPCGPYRGGTHCPTFSARRCAAPARRSGGYFFVPCRSAPFVKRTQACVSTIYNTAAAALQPLFCSFAGIGICHKSERIFWIFRPCREHRPASCPLYRG